MPTPNFDLIWGQTSPLTPYEFSDAEYQEGWNTVGSTPPARTMFDAQQRRNDLKMQDLNNRVQTVEEETESRGRQEGTAYTVGQFATSTELPAGYYLECVVAGNTSAGVMYIPDKKVGALVTDGTVVWKVLSYPFGAYVLTRSTPYTVGTVAFCPALAAGMYLECTTAGTTGSLEPTAAISIAIDGTVIADGTAIFTARSINNSYGMLARNKAYAVGDIAYSRSLPSYLRLECVAAGRTGAAEPSFTTSTGGGIIVDGTCTFIIDDVRDGTPVGQVRASMFVPAGYVKLEGATVNRENYPRLVALADTYSLWTDDTTANPGLFGEGDGSATMVLPNWTGRMAQFAATAGGKIDAGLPNVTGETEFSPWVNNRFGSGGWWKEEGAFTKTAGRGLNGPAAGPSGAPVTCEALVFNAFLSNSIYSASTTVQPPAINTFAIMRY